MTTYLEVDGTKFEIKENSASWTVIQLETPAKIEVSLNYSKVDYPTIEELKDAISNMYKSK